jgi:hypothetical protein
MSENPEELKIGDSVLIVGTEHDGALATIINIAERPQGIRYLVVFEDGYQAALPGENLSHRF